MIESDDSESDTNHPPSPHPDRLSIISDDSNWSELGDDVKDILRMKKYQNRQEKLLTINNQKGRNE